MSSRLASALLRRAPLLARPGSAAAPQLAAAAPRRFAGAAFAVRARPAGPAALQRS